MAIVVRALGAGEGRLYLEIVNAAIRGLARTHYTPAAIEGWVVPMTEATLDDFERNPDSEIRLVAELDGTPSGIGALVVAESELRACYVLPGAARRGCGAAIVGALERLARQQGLTRLHLAASLNAEAFYARMGYTVRARTHITLRSGHTMAAIRMERDLAPGS